MERDKLIWGWTTCLTYETRERLGYDHFSQLLDEMNEHGMKRLIIMMGSHYHFDPINHGLAWPVRNPKLSPMVDAQAINANPKTEFVSKVIRKAKDMGIEVFFEVKYAGVLGLLEGYPGVEFWTKPDGTLYSYANRIDDEIKQLKFSMGHICHDNERAHEYMRDQLKDLLEIYPEIDGIVMEWPGYGGNGCYCKSSLLRFKADTGKNMYEATEKERLDWENERIRVVLADMINLIKDFKSNMRFGFYSGFSPEDGDISRCQELRGHRVDTLKRAGVDFVMPYAEGRHKEQEEYELERVIAYMDPLNCYVHCTIRRNPPKDYPLPPKGPDYIKRIIRWAISYHKSHGDRFKGMSFFNEVNIPPENRNAVYEAIEENE